MPRYDFHCYFCNEDCSVHQARLWNPDKFHCDRCGSDSTVLQAFHMENYSQLIDISENLARIKDRLNLVCDDDELSASDLVVLN